MKISNPRRAKRPQQVTAIGSQSDDRTVVAGREIEVFQDVGRSAVVVDSDPSQGIGCLRQQPCQPHEIASGKGDRGPLGLAFQPIIDTHNGHPIGVEALVRLPLLDLEGGPGSETFAPIGEASSQFNATSLAIVSQAIEECPAWEEGGTLFIGLSGGDLASMSTMNRIVELVRAAHVPPGGIIFEVAEAAVLEVEHAKAAMRQMGAAGLRFVIVDFSVRAWGIRRLAGLPFDMLKLDGRCADLIAQSETDREAVLGVLEQSRALCLDGVVVTGVRTLEQAMHAAALGARFMQGAHFAEPLPANEALDWMRYSALPLVG
jgi:EAL domain-containing protein (putative c-di-GMP-specific phosphodiesterase class I)